MGSVTGNFGLFTGEPCGRGGLWSPSRGYGILRHFSYTSEHVLGKDSPADHRLFGHAASFACLLGEDLNEKVFLHL